MDAHILAATRALRQELHALAEYSGEETRTKQHLMDFLRTHTSLLLRDHGAWFMAVHEEAQAEETIAFRADMDAIPIEGGAAHLCGHDGHCAALCGLGLYLENKRVGRTIVLLFQHAEETGAGGEICAKALPFSHVSRIYAFHNIPGWPEGHILLREGTFACASRGLCIAFTGSPSHAAYPENGRNPGFAAARLITSLVALTDQSLYAGMTMATLIGSSIGSKAFGSAAGSAEVWLTLRAAFEKDILTLASAIEQAAREYAERDQLEIAIFYEDVFPATMNDTETLAQLADVCRKSHIPCLWVKEPFRWSEDFGYYGTYAKSVMVGIGAGEDWPQLHTPQYEFNDTLLQSALTLFVHLAKNS